MSEVRLAFGLSFNQKPEEVQTKSSIFLRVTAVALGIIAAIVGTLILLNIIGLSSGLIVGWTLISVAALLILTGTLIKGVKDHSMNTPEVDSQIKSLDEVQPPKKEEKKSEPIDSTKVLVQDPQVLKKQKILNEFTPAMAEALGGVDKVLELPVLENWDGKMSTKGLISFDLLKGPVVRGYQANGRPFLIFCYYRFNKEASKWDKCTEYLERTETGWRGGFPTESELSLRFANPVFDNTAASTCMLDKITRLMKGEAVGALQHYSDLNKGKMSFLNDKSADKSTWRPKDAYLSGQQLDQYMDVETITYERKPYPGTSELFLINPTLTNQENYNLYMQKFPNHK